MLIEINEPLFIPEILKLAQIVPDTPLDRLEKSILSAFKNSNYKLVIDKRDNEITGFAFATIEEYEGEDVVFVQFCVLRPRADEKYIGFELLARLRAWGMNRGAKRIITIVKRDPKGFMRKYNFSMEATVLSRPLQSCGTEVTKGRKSYEQSVQKENII